MVWVLLGQCLVQLSCPTRIWESRRENLTEMSDSNTPNTLWTTFCQEPWSHGLRGKFSTGRTHCSRKRLRLKPCAHTLHLIHSEDHLEKPSDCPSTTLSQTLGTWHREMCSTHDSKTDLWPTPTFLCFLRNDPHKTLALTVGPRGERGHGTENGLCSVGRMSPSTAKVLPLTRRLSHIWPSSF